MIYTNSHSFFTKPLKLPKLRLNSAIACFFVIYNVFNCTLYSYGLVTVTNQPTTPNRMVATLQYVRIVCFYGLYIRSVTNRQVLRLMYRIHTHIHYIISLEKLFAYCTKLLSPLSSNTRTSASWLATPLFIFRLFPVLRLCATLSPWQAVSICHISLCPSDTANIQRF